MFFSVVARLIHKFGLSAEAISNFSEDLYEVLPDFLATAGSVLIFINASTNGCQCIQGIDSANDEGLIVDFAPSKEAIARYLGIRSRQDQLDLGFTL